MRIPPRILAATALAATVLVGGPVAASAYATPSNSTTHVAGSYRVADVGHVCSSTLPSEAHDTLDLIEKGGPYPYPKDGTVFTNREGVLPKQSSDDYYHEYTVVTPGSPDRGARRIVTGEGNQEDYYTSDHYSTFSLVDFGC
ncbi:ribonuclease domain-containing protein [Streptomyces sp. NPDC002004]